MRPNPIAQGARPAGVEPGDEAVAARAVREMFGRVAPRYDLLNHLLSGQIDRFWRRCLVRAVRPYLSRPGVRVADLCCGTGDLALALARESARLQSSAGHAVLASDFSRPMLQRAAAKLAAKGSRGWLAEADATRMPLPDGCLDLITVAYGLRKLSDPAQGLREMRRLLKPRARAAVLDFNHLKPRCCRRAVDRWREKITNALQRRILRQVVVPLSSWAGLSSHYTYLEPSIDRFPSAVELEQLGLEAGFRSSRYRLLAGGLMMLLQLEA